ncbi:MAG: DNA mismatch repair endonuclease MutL [Prevotellaceae bacterium]|jgi:DNA mismatch repair protein MutL|nr:DNA mismatch repair endonuclease MutL [Prevotellaceae bacterium]
MKNIIQVLPDSVANQIAAGEVIQRPASVVKELVENAIDAGATVATVIAKEAGKTLIQVVDNGSGMSEVDARLAFERHATSKIRSAADLLALNTFGFRGEALASIVSIAEVEVKTRTADNEAGTHLLIRGSIVEKQEATACPQGTSIAVKNLFYNVPARRKFLKTDAVELRHIEAELRRVALCHPEVGLTFWHNGKKEFELAASGLKQRIVAMFGANKAIKKGLIDVETKTHVINLHGFISVPELAAKDQDKQLLFVNNRYFQSPYFRSAILRAYEQLIPQGNYPSYFVYLDVDPSRIDVNIHPAKIEIKFEDEQVIWQIVNAAVRESLGKYALAPTIDFEGAEVINIPALRPGTAVRVPQIDIDPTYNPFKPNLSFGKKSGGSSTSGYRDVYSAIPMDEAHPFHQGGDEIIIPSKLNLQHDEAEQQQLSLVQPATATTSGTFIQLKGKYILTPAKLGLMVVDQVRAHKRMLYEELLQSMQTEGVAQQELFPQTIELSTADYTLIMSLADELNQMGLDVRDFGNQTVVVQGIPAFTLDKNPKELVLELIEQLKADEKELSENHRHILAASMASSMAIPAGKALGETEMKTLVAQLLACTSPDICPNGKPTMTIISTEEIDKKFLK